MAFEKKSVKYIYKVYCALLLVM